jgi:signal transduction histidine kinase
MLPFLEPLRQSLWLKITALAFGCTAIGLLIWLIVIETLTDNQIYAVALALIVVLIIALLIGKIITQEALKSTDFLARAILLVTTNDADAKTPSSDDLGEGRDFLARLAKNVYSLASSCSGPDSPVGETELGFYKSLVNSLPVPVIVLDQDQLITYANEEAYKYIEKTAEETLNQPIYDAMNLSFSSLTLEDWLKDRSVNSVSSNEVWERVRLNVSDNRKKLFDLAAHYSNDDPHGLETILLIFDRTRVYERDDHDLSFVSLAVHELRAPLTIMRGYIEVFEDEISDQLSREQKEFMHNMSASAQQLTSFVSNILNVARIEENALFLSLKEEKWADTLKSACKDMELRAKVHNKKLVYDFSKNLPTVAVDKVSIYEVISNLLDNAIKYTHTDEDIVIKTYEKDGMVETTVTDKGVGVAEALIPHVFDKFYRAHQNKNSVSGTGFGLYLCRAIINAHGGNIWVKSKVGSGSSFGFTLPIYANVADQIKNTDNKAIIRGAHGWIKNHSFYRE